MARVVFLGTPKFGVPVLEALVEHHDVVAVVTQPDRFSGRGRRRVQPPPVKQRALAYGLRVYQPARLRRDRELLRALGEMDVDLFVIAAYGQILRPNLLKIPRRGSIGVHASLLPKLRGAAPIAAAILRGEQETGITLMLTGEGVDTGPIIAQRRLPIATDDTSETLSKKLSHLGAALLIEKLPGWLAGEIDPCPQTDAQATYARLIAKSEGAIDWRRTAIEIDRQVRAFTPWPGAFSSCEGRNLKLLRAHPLPQWRGDGQPGTVLRLDKGIAVVTGEGLLVLDQVQLAGKKPMDAQQFARGRRTFVGGILE